MMKAQAAFLKMEKDLETAKLRVENDLEIVLQAKEAALNQKLNEIITKKIAEKTAMEEKSKLFMEELDEEIRDSKGMAMDFYEPRIRRKAHEIIMAQEDLRPIFETAAKYVTIHPCCMKKIRKKFLIKIVKVKIEAEGGDPEEFQRQLDYDRSF